MVQSVGASVNAAGVAVWLGLPAGHGMRAVRACGLVFVASSALVWIKAAQNGIFLGGCARGDIPWTFAMAALVLATSSAVALSVAERAGPVPTAMGVLGASVIVLLALRTAIGLQVPRVGFVVYVLCESIAGLVLIHVWSTVSAATDARTSRKLLPVAGIGAAIAWLVGGLVVPPICRRIGANDLLVGAALLLALALTMMRSLARLDIDVDSMRGRRRASLLEGWSAGLSIVRREPLMRIAAALSLMALLSEQWMDLQLMTYARERLRESRAIAGFFGAFFAVTGGLSVLLLAGPAARLLARLGTTRAILVTPTLIAATSAVGAFVPGFGAAAALRGADRVLKTTVWPTATEQLQMPLPPLRRSQARGVVRGVLAPAGYAVSALLLASFPRAVPLRALPWLVLAMCLAMMTYVLLRAPRALATSLHRAVSDRRLSLETASPATTLRDGQGSGGVERDNHDDSTSADAVASVDALAMGLLDRSPDVRVASARAIERIDSSDAARTLVAYFSRETDRDVRAAMLDALGNMPLASAEIDRALDAMGATLGDTERTLLDTARARSRLRASASLPDAHSALTSDDLALRLAGLRALIRGDVALDNARLDTLLADPRLALPTARLLVGATRGWARAAWTARLGSPCADVRRVVVRAAGSAIRRGALEALPRSVVEPLLRNAVAEAGLLVSILAGIAHNDGVDDWKVEPAFEFLAHEVEIRIDAVREEILGLLLLLGRRALVRTVRVGRRRPSVERDALIAELLETELERSLASLVVPVFERLTLFDRARAIRRIGHLDEAAMAEPEVAIVHLRDGHLRRCARRTFGDNFATRVVEHDSEDFPMMPNLDQFRLLRRFDLFSELPSDDLMGIAEVVERVELAGGDEVFSKGDPGDEMYLVVSGEVAIVDRESTVAVLRDGEFFGDLAVIDRQPRSAGAVCRADTTLLRLRGSDLDELLAMRPAIASHFLRVLASRIREMVPRLAG